MGVEAQRVLLSAVEAVHLLGGATLAQGWQGWRGRGPPSHLVREVRQLDAAAAMLRHPGAADAVLRRLAAWLKEEAGDGKVQREELTIQRTEAWPDTGTEAEESGGSTGDFGQLGIEADAETSSEEAEETSEVEAAAKGGQGEGHVRQDPPLRARGHEKIEEFDEVEEAAMREAEEKALEEAEEVTRLDAEHTTKEGVQKAKREAEDKFVQEAVEAAKREAGDKSMQEAEEKAKKKAGEDQLRSGGGGPGEGHVRQGLPSRARWHEEFEEAAMRIAEGKACKEAEKDARLDAELTAKEAGQKAKREAEEKLNQVAVGAAKREAGEKAKKEVEEKAKKKAEENARLDAVNTTEEAVKMAKGEVEEKVDQAAVEEARMEEVLRILKRLSPEEAVMLMDELDCETWRRKAVRGTGGASARGCR